MTTAPKDLARVVDDLRKEGSDTAHIEVKRAAGGFPENLASTLSAMANRPGGGTIILGLDEADDFAPVGVYDAGACSKALGSLARNGLRPSVHVDVRTSEFAGEPLVIADVTETALSEKPCTVVKTGKAYMRSYDGDYELAPTEVQAFVANRAKPTFDRAPVAGATRDDLDPLLVDAYLQTCRNSSTALARFTDDEILVRTNVLSRDGSATMAGLLALGIYPQEFFPQLVIQASVTPRAADGPGTRASDQRRFDGPVPAMLEEVVAWVRRNTSTRVVFGQDGHGRDVPEYPVDAVRELVANALVHRDLGPWATNKPITLKIDRSRLLVANLGGLWSISVDRLGDGNGPPARRNESLVAICQYVRTRSGNRVIEALGTGIRTVLDGLGAAGMTPPTFDDQGYAFTVLVPNHALLDPDDIDWLGRVVGNRPASDIQRHVLATMRHGRVWTNRDLRAQFPMDSLVARSTLQGLVVMGMAEAHGDRGARRYSLAPALRGGHENAGTLLEQLEPSPAAGVLGAPEPASTRNGDAVLRELAGGPLTLKQLADRARLSDRQVSYALHRLRDEGLVEQHGRQGVRGTTYRRSPSSLAP